MAKKEGYGRSNRGSLLGGELAAHPGEYMRGDRNRSAEELSKKNAADRSLYLRLHRRVQRGEVLDYADESAPLYQDLKQRFGPLS